MHYNKRVETPYVLGLYFPGLYSAAAAWKRDYFGMFWVMKTEKT